MKCTHNQCDMFAGDIDHCCQDSLPTEAECDALHNICAGAYNGELALIAASAVTDWSFLDQEHEECECSFD